METIVDRVNTTGSVWLGTTLACTQCHNHKYDPFSQKEYYQFFAFFNNSDEPEIEAPTGEQQRQREHYQSEMAELEAVSILPRPNWRQHNLAGSARSTPSPLSGLNWTLWDFCRLAAPR